MLKIFVFIDIWFVKQGIQKWLKQRYAENEKKKKKREKKIDLSERGFEPQIFSNFPANDLNFHGRGGWWDQIIKSF